MKIRKITSLTAALAFVFMVLTSIVLYIVPQGRVAYWADWRLLGLAKTEWGNIHINLGLLFLAALALHIYYNWKPLISYLKDKSKRLKVFTPEFGTALAVTVIFAAGTYFMVPPFDWIMALNGHFKDTGAEKYGEPPYGHAELSTLETFCKKTEIDLEKGLELLDTAGYTAAGVDMTLLEIAQKYDISPQKVYIAMKAAQKLSDPAAMPNSPPPGTGNLTLADLCARFNLNMKATLRELKKKGIDTSESQTLKEIAKNNGIGPVDVYEIVRGSRKSDR